MNDETFLASKKESGALRSSNDCDKRASRGLRRVFVQLRLVFKPPCWRQPGPQALFTLVVRPSSGHVYAPSEPTLSRDFLQTWHKRPPWFQDGQGSKVKVTAASCGPHLCRSEPLRDDFCKHFLGL